MEIALEKAIKTKEKETDDIIIRAYENCINNYKNTIMFLKAERNAVFKNGKK